MSASSAISANSAIGTISANNAASPDTFCHPKGFHKSEVKVVQIREGGR